MLEAIEGEIENDNLKKHFLSNHTCDGWGFDWPRSGDRTRFIPTMLAPGGFMGFLTAFCG